MDYTPIVQLFPIIGVIAGIILAKNVKEELKPGEKYFSITAKLIIVAIAILLVFFDGVDLSLYALGILIGIYYRKEFFYLGLAMASSNLFIIASSAFIYGIPIGTLVYHSKKKIFKKVSHILLNLLVGVVLAIFLKDTAIVAAGGLTAIILLQYKKKKKN